jgi:hypothetical protein
MHLDEREGAAEKMFYGLKQVQKSSAEATKNDPGRPNILEKVLAPTH